MNAEQRGDVSQTQRHVQYSSDFCDSGMKNPGKGWREMTDPGQEAGDQCGREMNTRMRVSDLVLGNRKSLSDKDDR